MQQFKGNQILKHSIFAMTNIAYRSSEKVGYFSLLKGTCLDEDCKQMWDTCPPIHSTNDTINLLFIPCKNVQLHDKLRYETWFLHYECCILNLHLFVQPNDGLSVQPETCSCGFKYKLCFNVIYWFINSLLVIIFAYFLFSTKVVDLPSQLREHQLRRRPLQYNIIHQSTILS